MTATDTVYGNAYFKRIDYNENCRKMAVSVVILALLEKYSLYLCAVIAHEFRIARNTCGMCDCCISSVPLISFSTNEGERL